MIDEYAALAIVETKKKGAFVLPGIGKSVLVKRKARTRYTLVLPGLRGQWSYFRLEGHNLGLVGECLSDNQKHPSA